MIGPDVIYVFWMFSQLFLLFHFQGLFEFLFVTFGYIICISEVVIDIIGYNLYKIYCKIHKQYKRVII